MHKITWFLIGVVGVVLALFAWTLLAGLFCVLLVIFGVCWACGMPINVKVGECTTRYRWFTKI